MLAPPWGLCGSERQISRKTKTAKEEGPGFSTSRAADQANNGANHDEGKGCREFHKTCLSLGVSKPRACGDARDIDPPWRVSIPLPFTSQHKPVSLSYGGPYGDVHRGFRHRPRASRGVDGNRNTREQGMRPPSA